MVKVSVDLVSIPGTQRVSQEHTLLQSPIHPHMFLGGVRKLKNPEDTHMVTGTHKLLMEPTNLLKM